MASPTNLQQPVDQHLSPDAEKRPTKAENSYNKLEQDLNEDTPNYLRGSRLHFLTLGYLVQAIEVSGTL
jgi:hypothetical protein